MISFKKLWTAIEIASPDKNNLFIRHYHKHEKENYHDTHDQNQYSYWP